jgi:hypothetical protein
MTRIAYFNGKFVLCLRLQRGTACWARGVPAWGRGRRRGG